MPNFKVFDNMERSLAKMDLEKEAEKLFDKEDDTLIDMNVEQLNAGIRSDGSKISPPYSPRTISRKKKIGQPVDKVTLKDTGDFQNAIRVKNYPGKKELVSYDSKSEPLQDKYQPEILGVTDKNLNIVKEKMKPELLRKAKSKIKK